MKKKPSPKQAPKKHAKFSPSSAARWLACPGSVNAIIEAGITESPDSAASIEGTTAHECFEAFVKNGPEKVLSTSAMLAKAYPLEMVKHAESSATALFKTRPKGAGMFAEQKVSLSNIHAEFSGTADAIIVEDFGTLHVTDFKYGFYPVEPEHNAQLMAYAIGAAQKYGYDFDRLKLTVAQPRAPHASGSFRSWEVDFTETVTEWGLKFTQGVVAAEMPNAPLAAGEHCKFCPVKAQCPKLWGDATDQAQAVFAAEAPETQKNKLISMGPGQIATALAGADMLELWIGAIREHAFLSLKLGGTVPGWKLVEKRASRKWNDAAKAATLAKKIKGAFSEPELLSPAQFEKLGATQKAFVAEHASAVSSGLTLARGTDSRPKHDQVALDFAAPVTEPKKSKGKRPW